MKVKNTDSQRTLLIDMDDSQNVNTCWEIQEMNIEGIYWDKQLLFHEMLITAFDEPASAIITSKWDPRHIHLGSFKPEPLSFCSIMSSRRAPISGVK